LPIKGSKAVSESRLKSSETSTEIPTVEFCDILKKPFLYQSKIIKIRGNMSRFQDYITFYDERCVPRHPLISVVFDPPFQGYTESKASENLIQIVRGDKEAREGHISIFVSAVGLFEKIPSNERNDFTELQYKFTIRSIDSN
jgi:hypothetical protein